MKHLLFPLFFLSVLHASTAQSVSNSNLLNQTSGLIENKGQLIDDQGKPVSDVLFYSETSATRYYITSKGITFLLTEKESKEHLVATTDIEFGHRNHESEEIRWERIDLEIIDANINMSECVKEYPVSGALNFFNPTNPNGIYGVEEYQRVTFKNIYPNIDWEIYNSPSKGIKYDFVLNAGAKLEDIGMVYRSLQKVTRNNAGDLIIPTANGDLTDHAPISYFNDQKIPSQYVIDNRIKNESGVFETSFQVEVDEEWSKKIVTGTTHDHLIIDPEITWATFYGGATADGAMSIEIAPNGDTFIAGYCRSLDFPTLQDGAAYFEGVGDASWGGLILKFTESGVRLWATLYEGSNGDEIQKIILDNQGNIYCSGYSESTDFPLQDNGTFFQDSPPGYIPFGFILKFGPDGQRIWATLIEGDRLQCNNIAVNKQDELYVVGRFEVSGTFPYLDNGNFFQVQGFNSELDGFILKFDENGNQLWGTGIVGTTNPTGSQGNDFAYGLGINSAGEVYVSGTTSSVDFPLMDNGQYFDNSLDGTLDAFIMKFSNAGALLWSTLVGGSQHDFGRSVEIDTDDNVLLIGYTKSSDMTMLNSYGGEGDHFIIKFNPVGQKLWGRHFGGSASESVLLPPNSPYYAFNDHLIADSCGNYYFFFETGSDDVETLNNGNGYFDGTLGGIADQFLSIITSSGDLIYGSYLGGDGRDFRSSLAMNPSGDLILTGEWTFPTSEMTYPIVQIDPTSYYDDSFNGLPDDIFIVKMSLNSPDEPPLCETFDENSGSPSPFINFPNVFSPNQDDINDFFQAIKSSNIDDFQIDVLNRWGTTVFSSSDSGFKWNGNDKKDRPLVEGTYFWKATYTNVHGENFTENGFVVLVK